jgi:hypothetical protein
MFIKKNMNSCASQVGTTLTTKVNCETQSKDLHSKPRKSVLN